MGFLPWQNNKTTGNGTLIKPKTKKTYVLGGKPTPDNNSWCSVSSHKQTMARSSSTNPISSVASPSLTTPTLSYSAQETVRLSMTRLQIRLLGPYLSSFSTNSYGYYFSNELISGLKLPNFRFGPYSPTASQLRLILQVSR